MVESYFTEAEKQQLRTMTCELYRLLRGKVSHDDIKKVRSIITDGIENNHYRRDKYGINPTVRNMRTALLINKLIVPDRNMTIATMLYSLCGSEFISIKKIGEEFGSDVEKLVTGLNQVSQLYKRQAAVENENFHKLLFTFAEDIRVVIIMIIDRLALMREINHHENEKFVRDISSESRYLYAPLAHRLGLYTIKSELEDLSLKYLNRKIYSQISSKLKETKSERDEYITRFIEPIRARLDARGLKYEIKGRTKSINSIWNKMRKQGVDLSGMFDLFAIRVIIDTPEEREKADCWLVYSEVTDIYRANVSRLRDWISVPKQNGYKSLHITVIGPENKWVEVQIRTKAMDEIAERGVAAHWIYKGVKDERALHDWMNNVRDILEAGTDGQMELIRNMNMNIYDKEVFVFTPKGDLFNLPLGATILDFAFLIHSKLGCSCIGGKVDGKNQKINYKLKSGDTVEILTSSTQTPRQDWLNFVVTSKARSKIKQAVNEARVKKTEIARETLQRRFKNRKIELNEAMLTRLIHKRGYKNLIDFFVDLQDGKFDVNNVIDSYVAFVEKANAGPTAARESAENFVLQTKNVETQEDSDILVIGDNVKGINYKLSKCCNPIFGDKITGFIASDGAIKIHRADCGNVLHLASRYPYRVIKTRWSGKLGKQFAATLQVKGNDDIGIVSNITSLINKDGDAVLRNITINSTGGIFEGFLVIGVNSIESLENLIKRMKNLKGVKVVERM
ncbi:MAG: bifunctional (p)ppGpp synthetase/guanosine-3',5'-bis(diphosphate) 3'-pyrophosphohydrolase [Muribaculaceae bacterium]|nr:bifunctional (p)ppGpp synthetase/guanosine-3',5'-bis(diphosphate) 3'-pyrophosphohydrolase [Muribaculaceae bacterium]